MTSRPGASGSTTTARLSLTDHLHSRSALPSRPCCAELRHDLLGEPAELLDHHRLRRAHADAHVDVLEPREPGLEVLEVSDELLDRKSTRLNSSHGYISYAVFCLKKKKKIAPGSSMPQLPVASFVILAFIVFVIAL